MECLTSILQEQVGAELVNFRCQKKFFWQKRLGKYWRTGGNKLNSLNFCWVFQRFWWQRRCAWIRVRLRDSRVQEFIFQVERIRVSPMDIGNGYSVSKTIELNTLLLCHFGCFYFILFVAATFKRTTSDQAQFTASRTSVPRWRQMLMAFSASSYRLKIFRCPSIYQIFSHPGLRWLLSTKCLCRKDSWRLFLGIPMGRRANKRCSV